MQEKRIFQGVPQALARDGWWLDAPTSSHGTMGGGDGAAAKFARAPGPLALLRLVALADILFWAGLAFALHVPMRWATPALMPGRGLGRRRLWSSFQTARISPDPKQIIRNWAFPIGGTVELIALLMDVNPVAPGWACL